MHTAFCSRCKQTVRLCPEGGRSARPARQMDQPISAFRRRTSPPTDQNAPSATHLALAKVMQSDMKRTLVSMRLMNSSRGTSPDVPPSISSMLYNSSTACVCGTADVFFGRRGVKREKGRGRKMREAFKQAKRRETRQERERDGRGNGIRGCQGPSNFRGECIPPVHVFGDVGPF